MGFSYPSQDYSLMVWAKGHFLCFKGNLLLLQNNSSVLLSPTHSFSRSLTHIDGICVVLFAAAGPKGSKVNGCRASSTRKPPVSEANVRRAR